MDAFDPEAAARAVADSLGALGSPERAAGEKGYLKSDLEFFGVTHSTGRTHHGRELRLCHAT